MSSTEVPAEELECRICLDPDKRSNLIAPCACNGYSKWVHPKCLNKWRSDVDRPMAFYQCYECHRKYIFDQEQEQLNKCKNRMRHTRFYFYVSRDILLLTILMTLISLALGYVLQLIDSVIVTCDDDDDCRSNSIRYLCGLTEMGSSFYIIGGFILNFAIIGFIFVLLVSCGLEPRYKRPVNYYDETIIETYDSYDYRSMSHSRTRITRTYYNNNSCDCCDCCCGPSYGPYGPSYGNNCIIINNSSSSSNSDNGSACLTICLVITIIVVVMFAIVGFIVGIYWFIGFLNDCCIRHYHHLILKVKSDEYKVKDLAAVNISRNNTTTDLC